MNQGYKAIDDTLHKSEIAMVGKPAVCYVMLTMEVVGYILMLANVPDIRPGIIEAAAGIVLGCLNGLLLGHFWLVYLSQLSVMTRNDPGASWVSIGGTPMEAYDIGCAYRLVVGLAQFASFGIMIAFFYYLRNDSPSLSWPWVRPTSLGVDPFLSTMAIYFIVTSIAISIRGVRWYWSLRD
ncbi:MAG: hypothetical protein ACYC0V_20675 [Armatimonadota bacterium]